MIALHYELTVVDLTTKREQTFTHEYLLASQTGELTARGEFKRRFLSQVGALLAQDPRFEGGSFEVGMVTVTVAHEQATWKRHPETYLKMVVGGSGVDAN